MKKQEEHIPIIVIKYGGNAMVSDELQQAVVKNICKLKEQNFQIVIVHGGGPFIQEALDMASVESEFVGGQRKTTKEALKYVEMALRGQVNGKLVNAINNNGYKAVGLSGRDGKMVKAEKLFHSQDIEGKEEKVDIGQVGKVIDVDPSLLHTLLREDYIPVITCIANDEAGESYNINADLFAGSIAGHLNAKIFGVLTDVDGLLEDVNDPESLLKEITIDEIKTLLGKGVIVGGMIPKVDACREAIENGAQKSVIINGTKPEQIATLANDDSITGTTIKK